MRSRGVVVVLALVLATIATVGVFLYSQGVKEDARTGGDLVQVVVSKVDIPANTDLNALIEQEQFAMKELPSDAVVQDAITDPAQLRGRRNNAFIVAGEQIPVSRVEGGEVPGGVLSIPDGYQAITVSLSSPRAIGAAVSGGDNVSIYATFDNVVTATKKEQRQAAQAPTAAGGNANVPEPGRGSVTVVLVPTVQVLRVFIPTNEGLTGEQQQDTQGDIAVTLALTPEDAQKFVFALEEGSSYLSLLPPDANGEELEPLTVEGIISSAKAKP